MLTSHPTHSTQVPPPSHSPLEARPPQASQSTVPVARGWAAVLALLCGGLAAIGGLSFDGAFELGGIWRMGLACAAGRP